MLVAILDPFAGISGDMTLGSLLDLGLEASWLEGLPARLGFPDVRVSIATTSRCGLASTCVSFDVPHRGPAHHHDHGRTVGQLLDLVDAASVSDSVKERSRRALALLGEAEGKVHGVAAADVHLHEVGAVDALLDIVGACEGFEELGVDAVFNLPVAVGTGWVEAAHGKLPVPAPATAILLEGVNLRYDGPIRGEATTPTGAVLLRVLSQGPPPSAFRITASGWGAGSRDEPDYPNALRILLAQPADESGIVEVIATDVDDLDPEYVEPMRQALFDAGALDVTAWPTHAKKGRIGLRVEVLARPEDAERVAAALLGHSTTVGVRHWTTVRLTLPRRTVTVEPWGRTRVSVKVWEGPTGTRFKPEYEDVIKAAATLGIPALDVAREARALAASLLHNKAQDEHR